MQRKSELRDRPLLSICMTARNDNYCGNFIYRLETALNHMAQNAEQLGVLEKFDILITDWNSDQRLGDALHLSSDAVQLCRFVSVPPKVAQVYNPPHREFNTSLSVNVALRRANGRFLMFIPCDILFPMAGFKNLIDLIEGNIATPMNLDQTLMLVSRKFIPWEFIGKEPDMGTLEKYLMYNSWRFVEPPTIPGLNAHMGAIIMHRNHWHATHGLDESLMQWGWSDIELGLRMNQFAPSICLDHFGVQCYEMDSPPQDRCGNLEAKNQEKISPKTGVNDDCWGLGDLEFDIYRARIGISPQGVSDNRSRSKTDVFKRFAQVPVIPKLVQYLGPNIVKGEDWPAIYMLAFYMTYYRPQYFVDYSILGGAASYVVPLLDPSIYFIGINECTASNSGPMLANTLEYFREKLYFKGHFHLVSGDIQSAFDRLVTSIKIAPQYDFIYLRPEFLGPSLQAQLNRMIQSLSTHGALIYYSQDDRCFKETTDFILRTYPNMCAIRSYQYQSAVFIRTQQQDSAFAAIAADSEENYVNEVIAAWKKL